LPTNLSNASTGRAQRSEASTGAKRWALCPRQCAALWLGLKTAFILKALKNSNQKTPENSGRTDFWMWISYCEATLHEATSCVNGKIDFFLKNGQLLHKA
jgi:hypothetical protein